MQAPALQIWPAPQPVPSGEVLHDVSAIEGWQLWQTLAGFAVPGGNKYRVTVEEAPIKFANPDSPLLQYPNHINPKDFEGWVQERGLYFAAQWDPRYQTVLSSQDPGEDPLAGGEIWTRYGKGIYIFSAYAWFRQLPAGVPGAWRLFANLLSAK